MKIELELPDWCDKRHIYIMAGIELAAVKLYGRDEWAVKVERCNQCGHCCKDLAFRPLNDEGYCEAIEKIGDEYRCVLGIDRPFRCCVGGPHTANGRLWDYCSIRYEVVK